MNVPNNLDRSLIFQQTFEDGELGVRNNRYAKGVPSGNIIYENKIAKFNGGYFNFKLNLIANKVYTIRIKFKNVISFINKTIIDTRGFRGTGYVYVNGSSANALEGVYVNGSLTAYNSGSILLNNRFSQNVKELVFTVAFPKSSSGFSILASYNGSSSFISDVSLIEIYNRALLASEIKSLYQKNLYKEPKLPLLLDFDSTQGQLVDRTGKNTLTVNNVDVKRLGRSYGAYFNGINSDINLNNNILGTQPLTMSFWVYIPKGSGYRYLSNSKLIIYNNSSSGAIYQTNDNSTTFPLLQNFSLKKWVNIILFIPSSGNVISFVNGGNKTSTNCGPRVNGTSNTRIGSENGTSGFLKGYIAKFQIFQGIPSNLDIFVSRLYNSQKWMFL